MQMKRQTVGPFNSSQFSPLVFIPLWPGYGVYYLISVQKHFFQTKGQAENQTELWAKYISFLIWDVERSL